MEKLAAGLEAANPARFAKQRRQGGSWAALVFWGAIVAVIIYFVAG